MSVFSPLWGRFRQQTCSKVCAERHMSFMVKVILTFFSFGAGSVQTWAQRVFVCAAQERGGRTALPHPESAGSHRLPAGAGGLRAV